MIFFQLLIFLFVLSLYGFALSTTVNILHLNGYFSNSNKTSRYFVYKVCYLDFVQHWAFSDIRTGRLISRVTDAGQDGNGVALTCAQFHPDGLIFGTGTSDAMIKIWDLKEVNSKTFFNNPIFKYVSL